MSKNKPHYQAVLLRAKTRLETRQFEPVIIAHQEGPSIADLNTAMIKADEWNEAMKAFASIRRKSMH
jgi:hypothetical protein